MTDESKVVTVAEAAKLLKKSPKRIRAYIHQRRFVATKPPGFGNWLINKDSLHQYIAKGVRQ